MIGQVVMTILDVWYLLYTQTIRLSKTELIINTKIAGKSLALGGCSFLLQISLVAAMAAINSLIRKYGAIDVIYGQKQFAQIPMAGVGIVMKVFQIVISIVVEMSAGCIPIVGAGLNKRVKKIFTVWSLSA